MVLLKMESNNRSKFTNVYRWIRGIFHKEDNVSRIECFHSQPNGTHRLLEIESDDLKQSPEDIADKIIEETSEDAKNFSGTQTYLLKYYTEKHQDSRGRCVFKVRGLSDEDESNSIIEGSEPANEKGVLGMLMRHLEIKEKILSQSQISIIRSYEDRLASQDNLLSRMADRELKILELVGTLEDRKLERDIEYRKLDRAEKTKDKMMGKVDLLMPVIMSKLLPSGKSKDSNDSGIDPRLLALFESFDEKQMQSIIASLSDDQKAVLGEIYIEYREYHERNKGKKDAAE